MDDELIKRIMPVGDLVDRWCINAIKISKFDGQRKKEAEDEKEYLYKAIRYLAGDVADSSEFNVLSMQLMDILLDQWNVLDKMRDTEDEDNRGRQAILAQDLNIERVKIKNQINELSGSFLEHKQYGTHPDRTV